MKLIISACFTFMLQKSHGTAEPDCQVHLLDIDHNMFVLLRLRLSAVERGGAPGREGIQDGCPRWLPARGVRPDEAVLDPGLRGAALLPHAEGEAAAYQS